METGCWRTIGVWGREEPRCPELARVVHCRNCEVYLAAGRQLLDREPPAGYGDDWMADLAGQAAEEGRQKEAVLVFRVGDELLALPLAAVAEVAERRPVRTIPHRRDGVVLGLANVGGELRLCVSLEALFGDTRPDPAAMPPRGRLLVLARGAAAWAVPVDEALSATLMSPDELEPPPATVQRSSQPFLRGLFRWRDTLVGLLDDELLLGALGRRVT